MILDILWCQWTECDCHREFESIEGEEILNVIQHDRLNPRQIEFAKKRLDSSICEQCFVNNILWIKNFQIVKYFLK